MSFVIAVDGPAASGKGTVAAALARHYGLDYLDTGLLYRAVAAASSDVDDAAVSAEAASQLELSALDDPSLRTRMAGEAASRVAVHGAVREALLDLQRRFAAQGGGAVLDGRDIGTVIAPNATAKLFVTAKPEIRAERRWRQLLGQNENASFEDVLADIRLRDERDSGRAAAPLIMAADAHLLDTSQRSIDAAFREALRLVELARSSPKD